MIQSQIYDEEDRDKSQHQESASLTLREMSMQTTHTAMMRDLEMAASDMRDPIAYNREEADEAVEVATVNGHGQGGWKEVDPAKAQKERRSHFPRAFTDVIAFAVGGKDKDGISDNSSGRLRKSAENYSALLHSSGRTITSDGNDLRQSLLSRRSSDGFYSGGSDFDGNRDSTGNIREFAGGAGGGKKKITPSLVAKYIRNRSGKRGEGFGGGGGGGLLGNIVSGDGDSNKFRIGDDWLAKAKRAKSHG